MLVSIASFHNRTHTSANQRDVGIKWCPISSESCLNIARAFKLTSFKIAQKSQNILTTCVIKFVFLNEPSSASFCLFSSFQANITILTTNIYEKMLWPSSIRRQDSNPQPSEHDSPPIITRPGLPPVIKFVTEIFKNSQIWSY